MKQRLNYPAVLPQEIELLMKLEGLVEESGLPLNLIEMVKLRSSILNGCSFCVRLHTQRLRRQGEPDLRVDLVSAWREAPCFDARERATLEFTEALTLVSQSQQIPDELYDRVHSFFSDREMATLTLAIGMINTWNRFALAFQSDLSSIDYLLKKTAEMDEAFAESRLAACS